MIQNTIGLLLNYNTRAGLINNPIKYYQIQ